MIFHKENIKSNLFHFYALKAEWNIYQSIKDNSDSNYFKLLSVFDDLGNSPLFYAFLGGNKSIINEILSSNNIYLNKDDQKLNIPWYNSDKILHIILYNKNIEVFKFYLSVINIIMIDHENMLYHIINFVDNNISKQYYDYFVDSLNNIPISIDPYYTNDKGVSIFYYCILNNQEYIFEKILGNYLNKKPAELENPFIFLIFSPKFYTLSEKFRFNKNRVYFIHSLIYKYGVDFINKPNQHCNNLTNIAIKEFDDELLRLLISCGVNTLEKNNNGNTCLHACVKHGSIYAYKILIDFFSYSTLNLRNDNNETIYDNANIFFKDILSSRFKDIVKHKEQKLI